MNYEKKYKDLVKAVKVLQETNPSDKGIQNWVNENVPELAESEDERIKSAILGFLEGSGQEIIVPGISTKEAINWLEKQGEQRANLIDIDAMVLKYSNTREKETNGLPVNCQIRSYRQGINDALNLSLNIEKQGEQKPINYADEEIVEAVKDASILDMLGPKFKVGEWITNGIETVQITGYDIDYGYQVNYKGNLQHRDTDIIEKEYHLWSIEDAKDGDVLVYGDNPSDHHLRIIMLFETMRTLGSAFNHFHIFDDEFRVNSWCDCGINAHPATKEQRDLLFQKIKEAGYEWDAEKKELKLLITNGGDFEWKIVNKSIRGAKRMRRCLKNV